MGRAQESTKHKKMMMFLLHGQEKSVTSPAVCRTQREAAWQDTTDL